jgi:O-antigen/teichoic acid export membrane protein
VNKIRLTTAYFYSLTGVSLVALTGIATGIVSSRSLGPNGRGELTAVLLLPTLFAAVGNLAITQTVGYLDSPARQQSSPIAGAAVLAALMAGLAVCLCLVPFLALLLPNLHGPMLGSAAICLIAIPLNFVFSVIRGEQLAQGHFRLYNVLQVAVGIGQVVFMLAFVVVGRASVTTFGVSIVLAVAVVVVACAHIFARMISAGSVTVPAIAQVLSKSWAFAQPEIARLVLLRADVFVLARMVSNEELGLYAAASAVAFGQAFTASPISQVCFYSTSTAPDRATAVALLARQFRLYQILAIVLACVAVAIAPVLIRVAFGERFAASAQTSRILILSMAVWSCSQIIEGGLRGLDLARVSTLSNLIGLGILLVCSLWMVQTFGIAGMAASLLIAQSAALIASIWIMRVKTQCSLGQFSVFSRAGLDEAWTLAMKQIRALIRGSHATAVESVGLV